MQRVALPFQKMYRSGCRNDDHYRPMVRVSREDHTSLLICGAGYVGKRPAIIRAHGRTAGLRGKATNPPLRGVMVCKVQCERGAEVNDAGSLAGNESRDASSTIASAHSHRSALRRARRSCQNSRTPAQSTPATASLSHRFAELSESCVESELAITSYVLAHAPGITRPDCQTHRVQKRVVDARRWRSVT